MCDKMKSMPHLHVVTSSYASFDPNSGLQGFATTVGKPKPNHRLASLPAMNTFAPYGVFNIKPALSQPDFIVRYWARLDKHQAEIDAFLSNQAELHPRGIALLCWCTVTDADYTKPGGFCHRLIAGAWLAHKYGIDVPELTLPHSPTPESADVPMF